ncbi:DinB family protein [Mucilaginibacter pedocola]|uniref:Damage-inducible protein DinB n=1 Tax=Mucilaginibacter pedocola TaxID=1792845 RepID=A0A1S9PL15_9SPHI|nr:DinB family protein [Mucilaginibacter pedocola]OOQ61637.1 hypothetical protein BC343_00745 [Mucilaginibacter pedocola]
MKNYFTRLFTYDAWANRQMNGLIAQYGEPQQARGWMAHLLAAQQIWLKRCQGLPAPPGPLWPDKESTEMAGIITQNETDWLVYIETLQPEDFDKVITYKTLKGDGFENTLADILAHVINHGTHHRAQIGQQVKQLGAKLPPLDYVLYIRDLHKTTI